MKNYFKNTFYKIAYQISPFQRRLFLIFFDSLIASFSFQISIFLTSLNLPLKVNYFGNIFSIIIFILVNIFTGEYRGITRTKGSKSFYKTLIRISNSSLLLYFISKYAIPDLDLLKMLTVNFLILSSLAIFLRVFIRDLILESNKFYNDEFIKIAIYGAGSQGIQFSTSLRYTKKYKLVCFFDDDIKLHGRNINGIPIFSPLKFDKNKYKFSQLVLALPNLSNEKKRFIFEKFTEIKMFSAPSIKNIKDSKSIFNEPKPMQIENLLGRNPRPPLKDLMESSGIRNNIICVTGAGGSIGSELCRQIINLSPKKLVLVDISERNLYEIERRLSCQISKIEELNIPKLEYVLGDVTNELLVEELFKKHSINIVFHAAAYKHVPIVENNPLPGIYNNFLSTKVLCDAALKFNVGKFIFISTDKAVRPTNIMGASKRAAELLINSYSEKIKHLKSFKVKTLFSIVRFGNVIGSSGSVVPLFRDQINNGGPITITHKDITRYFMTISEAAQLVIQSCAITKGSDLFLLDMGEQVKIYSLAKNMIRLSNLTLKDKNNQTGDIEIKFTGLRPGEKLYEELLIESNSKPTIHPLIFKASNNELYFEDKYLEKFDELEFNLKNNNTYKVLKVLHEIVPDWEQYINDI